MGRAAKYKILSEIKLCYRFFNSDVIYSKGHSKDCSVNHKKMQILALFVKYTVGCVNIIKQKSNQSWTSLKETIGRKINGS